MSHLYEKVTMNKGDNYITIEDTNCLTSIQTLDLVNKIIKDPSFQNIPNISILLNLKLSEDVHDYLSKKMFELIDERIIFYHDLKNIDQSNYAFTYKSLHNISNEEFISIWSKSMEYSLNAPSSLSMEELMRSVQLELGEHFKNSCMLVYEKGCPIGVTMPHIEPGKVEEGRMYYFGLIPSERGMGKSKWVHRDTMSLLKNFFEASYYIGSTSTNNIPMLKTFKSNGCIEKDRLRVYKLYGR
ncbi:hypothetical protein [Rossellomorea aquimaris]|uniref:hypothetical protein n=1 Tax=Rossellomorea aquimaris TaxID=189382 RepID=UPI0007D0A6A9|nr:hypothetical protein [Rossellomorea aquimaris]